MIFFRTPAKKYEKHVGRIGKIKLIRYSLNNYKYLSAPTEYGGNIIIIGSRINNASFFYVLGADLLQIS